MWTLDLKVRLIGLMVALLMTSCTSTREYAPIGQSSCFHYQLQHFNVFKFKEKKPQMVVMDYSRDGSAGGEYTGEEVQLLKDQGHSPISYFSIGEAEKYRFYYRSMPKDLLLGENKNWPGNHGVKYWESRWYQIVESYLSRILRAGFDGVYLDIVDAFERFPSSIRVKAQEMEKLITFIASKARVVDPNFKIIIQNGERVFQFAKNRKKLLKTVSAVAIESLYYYGPKKMNNPININVYRRRHLLKLARKLPVYIVEYLDEPQLIRSAIDLAREDGFSLLATDRPLEGERYGYYCPKIKGPQ